MEKKKVSEATQEEFKRLVHQNADVDPSKMHDFTLCVMAAIEDSLMYAGAIPGKDYVYRDLLQAATPIVAKQWGGGRLTMSTTWHQF